jgi:hypothetical protein
MPRSMEHSHKSRHVMQSGKASHLEQFMSHNQSCDNDPIYLPSSGVAVNYQFIRQLLQFICTALRYFPVIAKHVWFPHICGGGHCHQIDHLAMSEGIFCGALLCSSFLHILYLHFLPKSSSKVMWQHCWQQSCCRICDLSKRLSLILFSVNRAFLG